MFTRKGYVIPTGPAGFPKMPRNCGQTRTFSTVIRASSVDDTRIPRGHIG
jgi:hypothetical protein